jgi:hypothetical protein
MTEERSWEQEGGRRWKVFRLKGSKEERNQSLQKSSRDKNPKRH